MVSGVASVVKSVVRLRRAEPLSLKTKGLRRKTGVIVSVAPDPGNAPNRVDRVSQMTNAVIEQPSAVNDVRGRVAVGFAVEVVIEGDVSVAWLSGELDVATAPLLADGLTATTSTKWPRLVLDLSNLGFVDAAGLGAIVRTRNELRSRSGELTLPSPSPFAARTLEIAGLAGLVRQFPPNGTRRPVVRTLTGGVKNAGQQQG